MAQRLSSRHSAGPVAPAPLRRRVERGAVAVLFCLAALTILYLHLIIWPQEYAVGQTVPFTVFSPITFDYIDQAKEDELSGKSAPGQERWVVDPDAADRALADYGRFMEELNTLRGNLVRWQKAGELEARRAPAEADVAARHGVDPKAVTILIDLDQDSFEQAVVRGREELSRQMGGEMTAALVEELQRDSLAATYKSPHQVYAYFLQPNLAQAPPRGATVDTKLLATVSVDKGSVIIAEGQVMDRTARDKLDALRDKLTEQAYVRLAGIGLLLLLLGVLWGWHLAAVSPKVFNSPTELAQQAAVFCLMLIAGLAIGRLPLSYSYFAVTLVVAALSTLVVLIYDRLFAVYCAIGLAVILSSALNLGADLSLYTAAGALLPTVLLSAQTARRTQVQLAFALAAQNAVLALVVVMISNHTVHWQIFPIAFGSGLLASILAFGLLPLIETVSGQITPGKLVELASPENKLLRRLKQEAHGTWSHSQGVAELAEEAAKAIKAGWLIAKVGALYHDIGKLKRPGFFAENIHDQSRNPHQGLPPETSARIVRDHVPDGLTLAREAKLPRDLWPFIAEHHGTYLIRYFYAAALREHESDPENNSEPQREDYSYLGPVPQSRESGVVMLADITEAVLRTKPEADVDEMRRIIDAIISDKIAEGQLAQSGLTLGDLVEIKEAFIRVLAAERHQRILYPGQSPSAPLHFHSRGKK
jgi:putative nucleotidyltransferase with HDIG domain